MPGNSPDHPAPPQEPGEIEEGATENAADSLDDEQRQPVPHKLHLRGLDTLNPGEVKAFVGEHYGGGPPERIEWIDDTSANLVFRSESAAQEALVALAAVEIADVTAIPPLECLPAKPFSAKPTAGLQLRLAVAGDRKAVGAAARSRFYLLHPEYDPEERRRRDGGRDRRSYRERDGSGRDRRGGGRGRRDDRYDEEEPEPFDVNLYDDDEAALAKRVTRSPPRSRRDDSRSSGSSPDRRRSYARRNAEKELFPNRRAPRERNGLSSSSRNRSASPTRDDDGDRLMDDGGGGRAERGAAARNRDTAQSIKGRISRDHRAKELFPTKLSGPSKTPEMDKVDPADRLVSGMSLFNFDGACDTASVSAFVGAMRKQQKRPIYILRATVTNRRKTGRTSTQRSDSASDMFNIRGMAAQRAQGQGLAIKGKGPSVRELFPDKFSAGGNAGKELFAEKLEGRGRRRQRAEDMFH